MSAKSTRTIVYATAVLLLGACAHLPTPVVKDAPPVVSQPQPQPQQAIVVQVESEENPIEDLLNYHAELSHLSRPQLQAQLDMLDSKHASPRSAIQKAMTLHYLQGVGDIERALWHLEGVIDAHDSQAIAVKPLAHFMAHSFKQLLAKREQMDKLQTQQRDQQRRIEQLSQKLEGLKAIERAMPTRAPTAPESLRPISR